VKHSVVQLKRVYFFAFWNNWLRQSGLEKIFIKADASLKGIICSKFVRKKNLLLVPSTYSFGVNFTNMLRAAFSYECVFGNFSLLAVFIFFGEIIRKALLKMLKKSW